MEKPIIYLPDDHDEFEETLISILDCYQGNERVIDRCTKDNVYEFITGHMCRILGLMASCPSSNPGIFGLNADCLSWTVSDVIERIPCEPIQTISVDEIKDCIRKICLNISADGNTIPIIFDEIPYEGENSTDGGCFIEKDIFGTDMPSRTQILNSSSSKQSTISKEELDIAKEWLSSIMYKKLLSAVNLKKIH